MSSIDQEAKTRIGFQILIGLIEAARGGYPIHGQFGVSDELFARISKLNVNELLHVAGSGIYKLDLNERSLNIVTQSALNSRSHDRVIEDALKYGASRDLMKRYLKMSGEIFRKRRAQLNISNDDRTRPRKLTGDEYDRLADLHNAYVKIYPVSSGEDHLRCLIYLSEHTGIDLNRIDSYYYVENMDSVKSYVKVITGSGSKE